MITGIPSKHFPDVRSRVRPFIENIASRDLDGTLPEEIEAEIESATRQLWVINDFQAICLTRVTREAVRIEAATGTRRKEWQEELDEKMVEWARALGKKRVVGLVRPGWYKWAKTRGYRLVHSQLAIEV